MKKLSIAIAFFVIIQPMIWFFVYNRFADYAIAHNTELSFSFVCTFSCIIFMIAGIIAIISKTIE